MAIDIPAHNPFYTLVDAEIVSKTVSVPPSGEDTGGTLVGPDGQETPLDPGIYELLMHVLAQVKGGKAVQVISYGKDLTTQQAADILNISRQYLVRLLDRGDIPYTKVGSHRRLRLADVLAYRLQRSALRREALKTLTRASQEMGDY